MNDEQYMARVQRWRANRISDAHDIASILQGEFPGQKVRGLDYGSNDGMMQTYMHQIDPTLEVVGADANEAAVEEAARLGRKVAQVREGYRTGYKDREFDFVTCLATLAHIGKQRDAIWEMIRVLKVGGLLIIETPHPAYDQLMRPMHWFTGYRGDPTIARKVWPNDLDLMISRNVMEQVSFEYTGRRLPWPFSHLELTSDYRVIYRRKK